MGSKIERINTYNDKRFDQEILKQHGAFIVDDEHRCSFKIINKDSAVVDFDEGIDIEELIDEFRFYTGHITKFYDKNGDSIKEFPPVEVFEVDIKDIQPSQFYADEEKVKAIGTFIDKGEDICIPLSKIEDRLISEDGHTRLFYAVQSGFERVKAFICDEPCDYTWEFSEEARKRGVFTPYDLKLISHEEYKEKWHKFCDDFFENRK